MFVFDYIWQKVVCIYKYVYEACSFQYIAFRALCWNKKLSERQDEAMRWDVLHNEKGAKTQQEMRMCSYYR